MHFKAFTVISFNLIGVTDMTSHIDGGEDKDIDMFSDTNNLNLTRKDLELIEAALHTQQKICRCKVRRAHCVPSKTSRTLSI